MAARQSFTKCQKRLAVVWLTGSAFVTLLMVVQSLGQRYGSRVQDAWGWLLPLISPMLLLIVGGIVAEAQNPRPAATVHRFAYHLSLGLSVFYLGLVVTTLLAQPLTPLAPLEAMQTSNLWLGPAQGLVGVAMGLFFHSRENRG